MPGLFGVIGDTLCCDVVDNQKSTNKMIIRDKVLKDLHIKQSTIGNFTDDKVKQNDHKVLSLPLLG